MSYIGLNWSWPGHLGRRNELSPNICSLLVSIDSLNLITISIDYCNVQWIWCIYSDCRQTKTGAEYAGVTTSRTATGRSCKPWTQTPYVNSATFPDGSSSNALNYCRNPAPDLYVEGVWCFADDTDVPNWEYCDVPLCGSNYICFTQLFLAMLL